MSRNAFPALFCALGAVVILGIAVSLPMPGRIVAIVLGIVLIAVAGALLALAVLRRQRRNRGE